MQGEERRKTLEEDEKLVNEIENAELIEGEWQKGQFIVKDVNYLDTSSSGGNGTTTSVLSIFDFESTDQSFDNLQREDKTEIRSLIESDVTT